MHLVWNSYIHVSVSDLYHPMIGLPILLQENSWTDRGNIYVLPLCGEYTVFALKILDSNKKMENIYKIWYVCRSRSFFQRFFFRLRHFLLGWCLSGRLSQQRFYHLPQRPGRPSPGTASGRTPGGGPSPGRLLAYSLKMAAAPSARLTPLTPMVSAHRNMIVEIGTEFSSEFSDLRFLYGFLILSRRG